jgi:SAM-dependent methyltransferase
LGSQEDFVAYLDSCAAQRRDQLDEESRLIRDQELFTVTGRCYVCGCTRDFAVRFTELERAAQPAPNWREHLWCPGCRLNSRLRACLHLFQEHSGENSAGSIYVPERRSPFYRQLRARFRGVVGSEFLGPSFKSGQRNWRGIRHEDISQLSFADGSFDAILCFEVLEHVADYPAALGECFRCLKTPGLFMFTIPFLLGSRGHVIRARPREDGSIDHLLPPEYHSDPFGKRRILCFRHFGWQLLEEMTEMGFCDAHAVLYWSRHYGYLGQESVVFLAKKVSS